jgi:hypothetical protein
MYKVAAKIIAIGVILISIYIFSQNYLYSDIEIVKNYTIAEVGHTIGFGISKAAGVNGSAKWKSFHPDEYINNRNVICVEAMVLKPSEDGNKGDAIFQFLLNRDSKYVEFTYFETNGEPRLLYEGRMALKHGILVF